MLTFFYEFFTVLPKIFWVFPMFFKVFSKFSSKFNKKFPKLCLKFSKSFYMWPNKKTHQSVQKSNFTLFFVFGQVNSALSHSLLGFPHTSPLNAQREKNPPVGPKFEFHFFLILGWVNHALSYFTFNACILHLKWRTL